MKKAPSNTAEVAEYAPRILIIDDEKEIIDDLTRVLSAPPIHELDTKFRVHSETDLAHVTPHIDADDVDIFIVDLKLKEHKDAKERKELGDALVRKISETSDAGVIVYSSEPIDQTAASLFEGADDYIPKGSSPQIIRSRVSALWRRIKPTRPSFSRAYYHHSRKFLFGNWVFEMGNRNMIDASGRTVRLSPTEHAFLGHIAVMEDHEIDKDYFAVYVLGRPTYDADRRIDNLVSRLRKKLDASVQLVAKRGGGYRAVGVTELVG